MLSPMSPLRNIPRNIHPKQAFFLDGIRHAAEISLFSYSRLTLGLTHLVADWVQGVRPSSFAEYFLDAWAFVDSVDRFRSLWAAQPGSSSLPKEYSPDRISQSLQMIRNIRNVSDHLSQKADQMVSLNGSALGILSWITCIDPTQEVAKTCLIYPGRLLGTVKLQLFNGLDEVPMLNGSGGVGLKAGKYSASLTDAYLVVQEVIAFAENSLLRIFESNAALGDAMGGDLFAIGDLQGVKISASK